MASPSEVITIRERVGEGDNLGSETLPCFFTRTEAH